MRPTVKQSGVVLEAPRDPRYRRLIFCHNARHTLGSYFHAAMSTCDAPTREQHTHRLDESSPGSLVHSGSSVGAGSSPVSPLAAAMLAPSSVTSAGFAHNHLFVSATITRAPDASLATAYYVAVEVYFALGTTALGTRCVEMFFV